MLLYNIDFDNGMVKEYAANVILADNLYQQVNDKGHKMAHVNYSLDH